MSICESDYLHANTNLEPKFYFGDYCNPVTLSQSASPPPPNRGAAPLSPDQPAWSPNPEAGNCNTRSPSWFGHLPCSVCTLTPAAPALAFLTCFGHIDRVWLITNNVCHHTERISGPQLSTYSIIASSWVYYCKSWQGLMESFPHILQNKLPLYQTLNLLFVFCLWRLEQDSALFKLHNNSLWTWHGQHSTVYQPMWPQGSRTIKQNRKRSSNMMH